MKTVYSFIKDRSATASIEFALTVIFFIFTIFFIAEVGRLAYVSSVIDLAVSEAAKDAKNVPSSTNGDYRARFENRMPSSNRRALALSDQFRCGGYLHWLCRQH
ncbi:TadE/TadG family type IV pilus assembly protein [Duffyella gerundensis]|uniref:TadE/TadG family type IV pilus assembly protein n=1 Tax=Duffyella gerundensis TaxID=1619313 RepID=UPI0021F7828E|nr:TadE/TadG family type IV pilus assembly protein [Duffyella gerundensis]